MEEPERIVREKRRNAAINFLDSFLPDGEESQYSVYTYSELLLAARLAVTVELGRIGDFEKLR